MTHTDLYAEWKKLCDENEAARDAHLKAFATVNQKFAAIGHGETNTNPTEDELEAFETTRLAWENVKKRMSDFIGHQTAGKSIYEHQRLTVLSFEREDWTR